MKKKILFYAITIVLAVLCFIFTLFVPETGRYTLVNEFFGLLLIFVMDAALIKVLYHVIKSKKTQSIIIIAVTVLIMSSVAGIKTIDVMKDTIQGPQIISLHSCEFEKRSTTKGIFSLNYYLRGVDENGTEHRLKISGGDFNNLREKKELTVSCYVNTGRILNFEKVSGNYE